ncbi:OsmC family protein [Nocardioides sp. NPDC047086]|uniref:OsmC family protein n=1 Tax=Nocardioides sp. NPDC047086 TaxID=3154810 RepID=UPI0033F4E3D5
MTETTVDNGVNVEALLGARAALQETPEAAKFTWRATNTWVKGTHSKSKVEGFFGLGEEQEAGRSFESDGDHPPQFAADNQGPTPVETVLVALGGCLTAGVAAVAQQRGIQLNSVTATIEGDRDIRGILGADADVRNGFTGVRVNYSIDADASPEDVEALVAQSQKRSAVFDILTNPTAVSVSVS